MKISADFKWVSGLLLVCIYAVYSELFSWQEASEIIGYILFRLPLAFVTFVVAFSFIRFRPSPTWQKVIAAIGICLAIFLTLPPSVIYHLFIR